LIYLTVFIFFFSSRSGEEFSFVSSFFCFVPPPLFLLLQFQSYITFCGRCRIEENFQDRKFKQKKKKTKNRKLHKILRAEEEQGGTGGGRGEQNSNNNNNNNNHYEKKMDKTEDRTGN